MDLIHGGGRSAQKGVKLTDVIDRYFKEGFTPQHAPRTLELNRRSMRKFMRWLGKREVHSDDYVKYCQKLVALCQEYANHVAGSGVGYVQASIDLTGLTRFFSWCVRSGFLIFNPMSKVTKLVKPQERKPIFTHAEYELMKERAKGKLIYGMIVLGYNTGMSLSDCCFLKWAEVDMEELVIRRVRHKMRRFKKEAIIPIIPGSDLHEYLKFRRDVKPDKWLHVDDHEYVMPEWAFRYKTIKGHNVAQHVTRFLTKCNLYLPHRRNFTTFRHTFASNLVNSGCSVVAACDIMGHSNPKTLLGYVKPDVSAMRARLMDAFKHTKKDTDTLEIKPKPSA